MALKTRKATGIPPWPLILIEGPEKSGKSWAAAQFTASERIGSAYWLDLGEGAADEYIAIPGAKYEVIDHDGTWFDIIGQIREVGAVAEESEQPVVLIIDSMTAEWDMVKDWISVRAKESPSGRRKLKDDPNAEIKPSMNLWNDAASRHYELMRMLMKFPGIVIMTARGKETAALDADGRPIEKAKDYRVEGHKNLPFDASVWVRLSRDDHPQVIGCRSVKAGVQPGVDRPIKRADLSLEHVVFDILGLDAAVTAPRDMTALVTDEWSMAEAVRTELGEYMRANKIVYRTVADRFAREHEEDLAQTRDVQALLNLLGELKQDEAAA